MSGIWYAPDRPVFDSAAGGEATLGEIYEAARRAAMFVDNTFAAESALEEWYDQRGRTIYDLTGESLENPMRVSRAASAATRSGPFMLPDSYPVIRERQRADWQRQVDELARRKPELAGQLLADETPEEGGLRISREADQRFSLLAGSRDGAGKWLAAFAGGISGAMRDPLQVATIAVGGGPGGARTITGRILATAFSEAAVNAGVELALQPIVQSYRAKAGLESGVDLALQNAAFAGLLGGVLGGGGRALTDALSRGGRSAGRAVAAAAQDLPPALKSEIDARLPEAAATIRDAMPPAARGAVDQVEMIAHLDATRPAAANPEVHDIAVSQAHRAIDSGEPPAFRADQAQVERVAAQMLPAEAAAPAKRPPSLMEFLRARGGVLDDKGELAAIGAGELARKPRGEDRRVPLDRAREAAEEAGYIGRAGETQVTSVADLLDAVDTELRGQPVFSREDQPRFEAMRSAEEQRARVESTVAEVAAYAGPSVDDRLIREAAEIALSEGVDAFDALERVLVRVESDVAKEAVAAARSGEPLPGWSDAELEAASAGRAGEPAAENGGRFDDPGKPDPDLEISPDDAGLYGDLALPGEDGKVVTMQAYLDDIAADREELNIVKACRA
jgi:hypothetical protein